MLILLEKPATVHEINKAAEDLDGYIKFNNNNPSREVINQDIREKVKTILKKNLPWKI